MSIYQLAITNGPLRPALQAAAGRRRVCFDTEEGRIEAHLETCKDLSNRAVGVAIRGHITSGPYHGRSFVGTYDPAQHIGTLNLSLMP
jgi:hypothetical protein